METNRMELKRAVNEGSIAKVEWLAESCGRPLHWPDDYTYDLLSTSIKNDFIAITKHLLFKSINVNPLKEISGERCTPILHLAIKNILSSDIEVIELLIHQEYDINTRDKEGNTALHAAVEYRNYEMTKLLLSNGADINIAGALDKTPLHIAAETGDEAIVELLLTNQADLSLIDRNEQSPILVAVKKGHVAIVDLFLKHQKNLAAGEKSPRARTTPLHVAADNSNQEMIELLLNKYNANVNAKDQGGVIPLHYAVKKRSLQTVKNLLEHGTQVDVACTWEDRPGIQPLHLAAEEGNLEIIQLLLTHSAKINCSDEDGRTPLHLAVKKGCLRTVEFLLQREAYVNSTCLSREIKGYTPLHCATEDGNLEIIALLLAYGADVNANASNKYNRTSGVPLTPLKIALNNGMVSVTRLLLDHGAYVEPQDLTAEGYQENYVRLARMNYTEKIQRQLFYAVEEGSEEEVKRYLDEGAFIEVTNTSGNTMLHCAVKKSQENIINLLLDRGANTEVPDQLGYTALLIACLKKNKRAVELLLTRGANGNAQDSSGKAILHYVVEEGCEKITKILLDHGVNINVADNEGKTTIHYAYQQGYYQYLNPINKFSIIKQLVSRGADINARQNDGNTILHSALLWHHENIVQLLVDEGVDVNVLDNEGKNLLNFALKHCQDQPSLIDCILRCGPDVEDKSTKKEFRKLLRSSEKNSWMIVDSLINHGFSIDKEDARDTEIFFIAVQKGYHKIVEDQLRLGMDVNVTNARGKSALFYAIENFDVNVVKLLIANKADVNINDNLSRVALHFISFKENVTIANEYPAGKVLRLTDFDKMLINKMEIVKIMLANDVDIEAKTKNGMTILHASTNREYLDIVRLLLQHNANPNCRTYRKTTPLHVAAEIGNAEIFNLLLTYNANVNLRNSKGLSALHMAVEKGNLAIVELLLNKGINVDLTVPAIKTTGLHIAAVRGHAEIVEYLLRNNADLNHCDETGATALHMATAENQKDVVEILLKYGCNINALTSLQKTAFEFTSSSYAKINLHQDLSPADYQTLTTTPINPLINDMLQQQVVRLKTANLTVSHVVFAKSYYMSNTHAKRNWVRSVEASCTSEIERLKKRKIDRTEYSLYDILASESDSRSETLARNQYVVRALVGNEFETTYRNYGAMINMKHKKGLKRTVLVQHTKFFFELVRNKDDESLPILQVPCVDKIFSFLSDKDLRALLVFCQPGCFSINEL